MQFTNAVNQNVLGKGCGGHFTESAVLGSLTMTLGPVGEPPVCITT